MKRPRGLKPGGLFVLTSSRSQLALENETGMVSLFSLLPNGDDLLNRKVTNLIFVVF